MREKRSFLVEIMILFYPIHRNKDWTKKIARFVSHLAANGQTRLVFGRINILPRGEVTARSHYLLHYNLHESH
jgi:hypothetical protein